MLRNAVCVPLYVSLVIQMKIINISYQQEPRAAAVVAY